MRTKTKLYSSKGIRVYQPRDQIEMNKFGGEHLPLYSTNLLDNSWNRWGTAFIVHLGKEKFLLTQHGVFTHRDTAREVIDSNGAISTDIFLDDLPQDAKSALGDGFLAIMPNVGLRHFSEKYRKQVGADPARIIALADLKMLPKKYHHDKEFLMGLRRITNDWKWRYISKHHPDWIDMSDMYGFSYNIAKYMHPSFWTEERSQALAREYARQPDQSTRSEFERYIPKPWSDEIQKYYWEIVTSLDAWPRSQTLDDFPRYDEVPKQYRSVAIDCLAVHTDDFCKYRTALSGKQLYEIVMTFLSISRSHRGSKNETIVQVLTEEEIEKISDHHAQLSANYASEFLNLLKEGKHPFNASIIVQEKYELL